MKPKFYEHRQGANLGTIRQCGTATQMLTYITLHLCSVFIVLAALCMIPFKTAAQEIPGLLESNIIKYHANLAQKYKSGDTNVPLLRIDIFAPPSQACVLNQAGKLETYMYNGISSSSENGRPILNATALANVKKVVNSLPPSINTTLPLKHQIHISGIRSNQWFHVVYDISKYPAELKKLYETLGLGPMSR